MVISQILWICVGLTGWSFLKKITRVLRTARSDRQKIDHVISALVRLEAGLLAGWVLESEALEELLLLPVPWGRLAYDSIRELRKEGAPVLPSLHRLRKCAEFSRQIARDAQSRSSQNTLQMILGLSLVPLVGAVWPVLLPDLKNHQEWWWGVVLAMVWASTAGMLMRSQIQRACWGGLAWNERLDLICAPLAGERLLSAIRSGQSLDLAWSHAVEFFPKWQNSIWESASKSEEVTSLRVALRDVGRRLCRVIQWSLWEGRPAFEVLETELTTLQKEIQYYLEKETALLGTRTLMPLMLGVVPPVFGLLGWSLWMLLESGSGWIG